MHLGTIISVHFIEKERKQALKYPGQFQIPKHVCNIPDDLLAKLEKSLSYHILIGNEYNENEANDEESESGNEGNTF